MFGYAFHVRNVNDSNSLVVYLNLLSSVSAALVGSMDYDFANQIIQYLTGKLLWVGVSANVLKKTV